MASGVLALAIGVFGAACTPLEPTSGASRPDDLAGQLTQAFANDDYEAFRALQYPSDANAVLWRQLQQFELRFEAAPNNRQLRIAWRVPGDRGPAWHLMSGVIQKDGFFLGPLTGVDDQPQPIWIRQGVTVETAGPVTVIGSPDSAAVLELGRNAVSAVQSAQLGELTNGWNGNLVIETPAEPTIYTALLGADSPRFTNTAALTWTEDFAAPATDEPAAHRIVVNPQAFSQLSAADRQLVVTHEAVHVAIAGYPPSDGGHWLTEGLADWVALPQDSPQEALAKSQCPGLSAPMDSEFTSDDYNTQQLAYAKAWALVSEIADESGEDFSATMAAILDGTQPVDVVGLANGFCAR
jgi:hypothetical protein